MGGLIGLRKSDWNKQENTLHIQSNIQSVKIRDASGDRIGGKKLIENTIKTYYEERIIPLNANVRNALEKLCNRFLKANTWYVQIMGVLSLWKEQNAHFNVF